MGQDTRNLMDQTKFNPSKILNFDKDILLTMTAEKFVVQSGDLFSSIFQCWESYVPNAEKM